MSRPTQLLIVLLAFGLLVFAGSARAGHAPTPGGPPPTTPTPPPETPPCGQNGETCCPIGSGGDPVDLWNGREFLTHTDLSVAGVVGIRVRRSYDSQSMYDSALGYGWAFNYFMRIYEYADGSIVLRRECGVRRPFVPIAGAYQTPLGEHGTLTRRAEGGWSYAEQDGSGLVFDAFGRLVAQVAPHGARIVFEYDDRGLLPIVGVSPYGSTTPGAVARDYRLVRVLEQDAAGGATGVWMTLHYDEATGRLIQLQDSAGRSASYVHDGVGNLVRVDLPQDVTLDYAYEDPRDPHNATLVTESRCDGCAGAVFVNVYDAQDRVIRQDQGLHRLIFDYPQPLSKTLLTEETYGSDGALLRTATTTWEFNTTGNPVRVTDALGHQRVKLYDLNMSLRREEIWENRGTPQAPQRALVSATEWTYRADGKLETQKSAAGFPEESITTYDYHPSGLLRSVKRPSVVVPGAFSETLHIYEPPGFQYTTHRIQSKGYLGDGSAATREITLSYDGQGRLVGLDGPRPGTADAWSRTYTGDFLAAETAPLAGATTFADYTPLGLAGRITEPSGVTYAYTYDAAGRVETQTVAGQTTSFRYTAAGDLQEVKRPRQNVMSYETDAAGSLKNVRDHLGNTMVYEYDSGGNRTAVEARNAGGAVRARQSYTRDALGQLKRVVEATRFQEYDYDGRGNIVRILDGRGLVTTREFDSLGRLRHVVRPGAVRTSYTYNILGRINSVTDGNGNVTEMRYDDFDQLYERRAPDSGITRYGYDEAGRLTSTRDGRGVTVSYEYDAAGRLTKVDQPSEPDEIYTYDNCPFGRGRLCSVADGTGTTSYEYDATGEVSKKIRVVDGVSYVTSYGHDANGNLEEITYPSGRRVVYQRDMADRVIGVSTGAGESLAAVAGPVTYEPFGGLSQVSYANGRVEAMAYDSSYHLTGLRVPGLRDWTLVPDGNGNIKDIVDNLDAARTRSFSYDSLDRLQGATGPWGALGWTYDKVGNRLTQTAPEGASGYSYAAGTSRLTAVTGPEPHALDYDDAGNLTSDNGRLVTYDEQNRLRTVGDGSGPVSYAHDWTGRLTRREHAGTVVVDHYDESGRLLAETNPAGQVLAEYLYLDHFPLAVARQTGLYFIHSDQLGSPMLMTDQGGAPVWQIDGRPFGDLATITGDAALDLRFPGQYADAQTGWHDNGFRTYAPSLGRYTQPDPISTAGLDYRSASLYAYVGDSPISWADPDGLKEKKPPPPPPVWEPDRWNDGGTVQNTNNCYSYACNRPDRPPGSVPPGSGTPSNPHKPHPTHPFIPLDPCSCNSVMANSQFGSSSQGTQGMRKPDKQDCCKAGYHRVWVVVRPKANGQDCDAHYYREDANGKWSHKRGEGPAQNTNGAGEPIKDPRTFTKDPARNYGYSIPCGLLCAGN
jgi:RHS repeat-associated protein